MHLTEHYKKSIYFLCVKTFKWLYHYVRQKVYLRANM